MENGLRWLDRSLAMEAAMGSEEAKEANKLLVDDEEKFTTNTVICFLSREREIFNFGSKQ
jgi:hypothetical protein